MEDTPLRDPWLVAGWPGMGVVSLGAVTHLESQLDTELVAELAPSGYFDITQVLVKDGLIQPAGTPRNSLHLWRNPDPVGRDLLIFVGEAQPAMKGYEFCQELMEHALTRGVTRVLTFAAMATPSHPKTDARVFGVANRKDLTADLEPHGVVILGEGEISGLNGVLLAAAIERGVDGVCLLGEFPYFASGIRNPKASAAVLRAFGGLAGIDVSCAALDEEAKGVEEGLVNLLERLQKSGPAQMILPEDPVAEPEFQSSEGEPEEDPKPRIADRDRERIQDLFEDARQDRQHALRLKALLDRLGVFKEYEDEFLDLFKRGE